MVPSSPLRYPGGKGRLLDFFSGIVNANKLRGGVYVEAFAGGAAIGTGLLLNGIVERVVINDLDRSVWAFWKAILEYPERFVDAVSTTPLTIDEWMRQKKIQSAPDPSIFELGFSTFFLNRTNRSGVMNAGVIGGLDQEGDYKLDARFNREALTQRIRSIAEMSDKIDIHNLDAEEFIKEILPTFPTDKTLVYFDPPYYVNGKKLYMNYYENEDHQRLSEVIEAIPHFWCVSYDDVKEVRRLYSSHRIIPFQLSYCAHSIRMGKEIMIFSDEMKIPRKPKLPQICQ
jgi:DNA adenine methylase